MQICVIPCVVVGLVWSNRVSASLPRDGYRLSTVCEKKSRIFRRRRGEGRGDSLSNDSILAVWMVKHTNGMIELTRGCASPHT